MIYKHAREFKNMGLLDVLEALGWFLSVNTSEETSSESETASNPDSQLVVRS